MVRKHTADDVSDSISVAAVKAVNSLPEAGSAADDKELDAAGLFNLLKHTQPVFVRCGEDVDLSSFSNIPLLPRYPGVSRYFSVLNNKAYGDMIGHDKVEDTCRKWAMARAIWNFAQKYRPEVLRRGRLQGQFDDFTEEDLSLPFVVNGDLSDVYKRDCVYEIKPTQDRGLAMFATQEIARGTRILAEKPVAVIRNESSRPPQSALEEAKALARACIDMPIKDQIAFFSLHASKVRREFFLDLLKQGNSIDIDLEATILLITLTNGFEAGAGQFAVCCDASRINHSCVPNGAWTWNSNIEQITIHAMKPIAAGEEITVAYRDPLMDRKARHAALKSYGFLCKCPACDRSTQFGQDSDRRRKQLLRVHRDLKHFISATHVPPIYGPISPLLCSIGGKINPIEATQNAIDTMEAEGVLNFVGNWQMRAALLCRIRGDIRSDISWMPKALEWELCRCGDDHPTVAEVRTILIGLESKRKDMQKVAKKRGKQMTRKVEEVARGG